jgi:hypothetical protein
LFIQHGWKYIKAFFWDENVLRYANAMTPGGRGPLFYVPVLLGDLFPWAPLLVAPLVASPGLWRRRSTQAPDGDRLRRLLWLWIAVFVAAFSFSQTKEDLYIFPTAPAVAVLVADALVDSFSGAKRLLGGLFLGVCAAAAAFGPAVYWLFGPSAGYYAVTGIGAFAILLSMTGIVAFACWARGQRLGAVTALALGFIALNYVLVGRVLPGIEPSKPVRPLARTLAARAAPDAKVGFFMMDLQSFVYYTGRRAIEPIGTNDQAKAFFYDERESWALMGAREWEDVRTIVPNLCIVDKHPLSIFDATLEEILARKPPLDALLIKNHCTE